MITYENGAFLLNGEGFSCLLQVNEWGQLEQLHFGAPLKASDREAMRLRPGIGWGASVLLADDRADSCPDVLPFAWSGSGRGDYRESPLDVGVSTDFRYESHQIYEGFVPMTGGLPQARGTAEEPGETLEIVMSQPGARLHLYFTVFGSVMTRRTVLVNTGQEPMILHKCMSFMMDLPGEYEMTTFDGSWIAEMRDHRVSVEESRVVNESTTGFSSHRHNPGFLLSEPGCSETSGRVYGINLIYTGNHYASAQRSFQGLTRVMQGISPDHFSQELAVGASFETPEAVLCFSDRGFGEMSRRMHRFVLEHIVPAYWHDKARPVLYNDWEGLMFDFDQRKLLSLAKDAKELGCELFVLDDGWFGQRNDDKAGLGDYEVNKKKLPAGITGLAEKITGLGTTEAPLAFGLWFEPESVNPDSDLYRSHPDWALTDEFEPVYGRHQLLLDLTRQEVRDYIVENVTAILDSAKITYVKWDMNRHSVALGAKAHAYILGLYEVLRRIFGPRQEILLESCSSGGNRFDLGMLCFGPQVWCSDDTDPIERLTIQGNLSYLYPQSTFGAHVSASPHAQTLRNTTLATRGNVSFFGCLGYEMDLKHLLPIEKKEIQEQIAFYKQYREVFQFGQFRRLKNGWQVQSGDTVIAGVFRHQRAAAPGYEWMRLVDLEPEAQYQLQSREQALRVGQFGSLVKHVVPVNLNPNGMVLRTADRHVTLPDGQMAYQVSGSALMSGVPLLPLFRGTGYDKGQRTILDNGSEVFIITKIKKQEHE